MSTEVQSSDAIFEVVINHEEQYSFWPADKALPPGWGKAGMQGSRERCLEYIREVWKDMRPRSLREQMTLRKNDA